jgi:GTP diphosphokinase / guanosine-3',5'-bis(diphosphate) 3'-diphosphatase
MPNSSLPPHAVQADVRATSSLLAAQVFLGALAFAAHKHRDQRRKGTAAQPYINHPIAVALVLAGEGGIGDTEILMAAVLHDTIEDTETTAEELLAAFGERVTAIVLEVTDDKSLRKEQRKALQVEHAAGRSLAARLVKLADKICNVRDIASDPPGNWSLLRQQEYFDWANAVVDRLRGTHAGLETAFDAAFARRPLG